MSDKVIVVGIDGSRNSRAALSWAAGEAAFRRCDLVALLAWALPAPAIGLNARSPRVADVDLYAAEAQSGLETMVAEELGAGHRVACRAIRGPAVRVLVNAGRDAEMLVVGARGSGGFSGLRVGSVTDQVVRRAPCPTLVVPAARSARGTAKIRGRKAAKGSRAARLRPASDT